MCQHSVRKTMAYSTRSASTTDKVPDEPPTSAERLGSIIWVQRLKRLFNIEIQTYQSCGSAIKVISASKTQR
jgi:hypothetical protein